MEDFDKFLNDIKPSGKEEFSVPDGYFEKLPHRVMDRIHAEEEAPVSIWKWLAGPVLKLGLGALALMAVTVYIINQDELKSGALSLEDYSNVTYSIEELQMAGIDEDEVISALLYEDIETEYQEISDDEYILDNIDMDLLLQEL